MPVPVALPAGRRRVRAGHAGAARIAPPPRGGLPCRARRGSNEGVLMKVAVVGGGSTYTPELVDGVARLAGGIGVTEMTLVDPDTTRLEVVGPVSARIMAALGHPAKVRWTTNLDDGLGGAGAVL